jgi:putative sterol carrier protein
MRRLILFLILGLLPFGLAASPPEQEKSTPQDVFDAMRTAFRPEKAIGVHARYQFIISGPHGGEWWIEVSDGRNKMGRGTIENPDVTIVASDKDWVAIANNQLSGVWATLTGRLKVRGDHRLGHKLDEMFP